MTYRKKLIEVALPLEAINEESSRRKRKAPAGYPTTLHKWWAQRPLAACRAVLFSSVVNDPSTDPKEFPTDEAQETERQRLFGIIEDLIKWENSNNERVLGAAREEMAKATNGNPPPLVDPFCGGGSIPLEAQRLGLQVYASDLNPVAVVITKALIEIPARFTNRPPVNPESRNKLDHSRGWQGSQGLVEDVLHYGKWMRDRAEESLRDLYPTISLENAREVRVVAWLWARTVRCSNPACGAMMPLVRSFALSTGKDTEAWVEPEVSATRRITFRVKNGPRAVRQGTVNRRGARCLACGASVALEHVRAEGRAQRMGVQLMAIVAEGENGRIYLDASDEHVEIASQAQPDWRPNAELPLRHRNFQTPAYGMPNVRDLFTPRQLVALTTLSNLIAQVRAKILKDAADAATDDDDTPLEEGGRGAAAYSDAVVTYLAFAISRAADYNSCVATWRAKDNAMRSSFSTQAIPMVWDFAEGNPFASSSSGFLECCKVVARCIQLLPPPKYEGQTDQLDARSSVKRIPDAVFCTDPPYYNNICYADLSDFFYVWLRRSLNSTFPKLFSTLLVPKSQELVATPHRFDGDRAAAKKFFEDGFEHAFKNMRAVHNADFPLTVFYAFKQSEDEIDTNNEDAIVTASTGWETLLEGLIRAGFAINGTWPMRTEGDNRQVGIGANALASSILLVCRARAENAPLATRREFLNALKRELPTALKNLQRGNIAPVDLAQAAIGPGMAVFSRYSKVVESDGSPMRVRTALQLINQALDEVLTEQETEYDAETRWAVAWFEQFGLTEGAYGTAEILSKAKNTSVSGMDEAGVTVSRGGKVRLIRRDELVPQWDPARDDRLTVWEVVQHLIHELETGGEAAAADLFVRVGGLAEIARDLAYRLYTTSERKGWTQEALAYNSLVVAWPEIKRLAGLPAPQTSETLFDTAR